MSDEALQALQAAIEAGEFDWPSSNGTGKALFINGRGFAPMPSAIEIQQYFRPYTEDIDAAPALPEESADGSYDAILLHGTKNSDETRYLIARALELLKGGGRLICFAPNDAGGRRLKDDLSLCGLEVQHYSKNKCQVVWGNVGGQRAENWKIAGMMRPVLDGAFRSRPGIFGWDKIDTGSALLTSHMPDHVLSGLGADFGCGYGYLAVHILQHNYDVAGLYCLDADYRAVQACRENVNMAGKKIHYIWADLTKPQHDLPPLDWIVMNPPFHEGKTAQYSIGTDFIKVAAQALKAGGDLWMVANAHLPYETVLDVCFKSYTKVSEEKGFKVFHAQK